MSEQIIPNESMELSAEELDTVAGGLIDVIQFAKVETNFEKVDSFAVAGKGFAATGGTAVNDETHQIAFRRDLVD